ncbi:hypothetical protein HA402_001010 [Bradysia odoriphaga]|nr:hypothetical protein HA402_001010 [Bradysia odoriphaga]
MGITGLIQFVENASNQTNIKEFKGSVVCVDAYCWLHRGIYACSEILACGGKTDVHIKYCLKYVKMLLHHQIKPILVFDGQHLPAKELTEKKRRESRKQAKTRAAELLRLGKKSEARKYFNRCVDVSHKMALELMHECRKLGVDCIVAPYEADAQLAFLNISGIADYVITEDSDLTLFGCKKVLFKLDLAGNCLEVDTSKLHLAMDCSLEKYSFDKFRYMCILSGCDYLDSLPGIGLARACKFILMTEEDDMNRALDKIPAYLNKRLLEVTPEYKLNFLRANATFKHMFVYDPRIRRMVRLTEPSERDIELCCNAGSPMDDKTAFQLAIGNLDPFTLEKLDNWEPGPNNIAKKSIWQNTNDAKFFQSSTNKPKLSQGLLQYRQKSVNKFDDVAVTNEVSLEETLARENDILSAYSNKSPPPSKKRKTVVCDEVDATILDKVGARNPFCLARNSTDEPTTNLRPLTKIVSPVKKPAINPSPLKTPTKMPKSPAKKANAKAAKRKLTTTTLVLSRFFKKPEIKTDKETDHVDNSNQIEVKENFLHVKSLYQNSVNNNPTLYEADTMESKVEQQECKGESASTTGSERNGMDEDIVELISDSEDDRTAIKATLNKFIRQKEKPKIRVSGLKKAKSSLPSNQPSLAQFMFTKRATSFN